LSFAKEDVAADTIGRSWINGILHRTDPDPADIAKIRFVAYEISSGKDVGTLQGADPGLGEDPIRDFLV
jgi:hypothetical protein